MGSNDSTVIRLAFGVKEYIEWDVSELENISVCYLPSPYLLYVLWKANKRVINKLNYSTTVLYRLYRYQRNENIKMES